MLELLKALATLAALTVYTVSSVAFAPTPPPLPLSSFTEEYRKVEIESEILKEIQQKYPACFLPNPPEFRFLCPFGVEYHVIFFPENIAFQQPFAQPWNQSQQSWNQQPWNQSWNQSDDQPWDKQEQGYYMEELRSRIPHPPLGNQDMPHIPPDSTFEER